jgi:hypothetical protein
MSVLLLTDMSYWDVEDILTGADLLLELLEG